MSRLASVLYLASCIAAANAASSVPIATQPVLSTVTVSTVSDALTTSLSSFFSTSTVVLLSTLTSQRKTETTSVTQLSIFTSESAVVASEPFTELGTIISTIGSTTIYSEASSTSSTSSTSSSTLPTSTTIVPPAIVATSSTEIPQTTPVNIVTSTASTPVYSTSYATTPAPAATTAASTASSPSSKSSKKLSAGAAAGIAIAAALLIGGTVGVLVVFLGRRRRQKKWARKVARDDSTDAESKKDLFSPDANAGYDSMWKAPAAVMTEKDVRPGTANTSTARVSPISHERGDSSTLGRDAPSIAPSHVSSTPKTDKYGDRPFPKPATNFSTPNRRTGSITALPPVK